MYVKLRTHIISFEVGSNEECIHCACLKEIVGVVIWSVIDLICGVTDNEETIAGKALV